jgi:hypothetical protein
MLPDPDTGPPGGGPLSQDSCASDVRSLDARRGYPERLGHVDLAAFDDDGNALEIWPCGSCDLWHVEVVSNDDGIVVREWHAGTCEHYLAIVEETADE